MKKLLLPFFFVFLFCFAACSESDLQTSGIPAVPADVQLPDSVLTGETEEEPDHEHEFSATVLKEATCTEDGLKIRTCSVCGKTIEEVLPKTPHQYQLILEKPTSCSAPGVTRITCTLCGDSRTETIPMYPHSFEERITKEATCVEPGIKTKTCRVCGAVETEPIPVTEHQLAESVEKAATCKETGVRLKKCRVCGLEQRETIPIGEHDFVLTSGSVATCTAAAQNAVFTCSVCGQTKEDHSAALGHTTQDGVCTRCGSLCRRDLTVREGQMVSDFCYCTTLYQRFYVRTAQLYTSGDTVRCRGTIQMLPSDPAASSNTVTLLLCEEGKRRGWQFHVDLRTITEGSIPAGGTANFDILICDWSFLEGRSVKSFDVYFDSGRDYNYYRYGDDDF